MHTSRAFARLTIAVLVMASLVACASSDCLPPCTDLCDPETQAEYFPPEFRAKYAPKDDEAVAAEPQAVEMTETGGFPAPPPPDDVPANAGDSGSSAMEKPPAG